jgi:hypothetical protein
LGRAALKKLCGFYYICGGKRPDSRVARRLVDEACTWMARRESARLTEEHPDPVEGRSMPVDYMNAAMGLMFLAVWAMIWQFATYKA